MTKRLVEIDDADLDAARTALATSTTEHTVALALREAAAAAARRRAVAERERVTVLHDDADHERVASTTGQRVERVVPRGSVP